MIQAITGRIGARFRRETVMSGKTEKICRLTELPTGEVVHVARVDGGYRVTSRLSDMGLFPGTEIEKLRGNGSGPVIVRLGPSRLALGRGVAEKIIVERRG